MAVRFVGSPSAPPWLLWEYRKTISHLCPSSSEPLRTPKEAGRASELLVTSQTEFRAHAPCHSSVRGLQPFPRGGVAFPTASSAPWTGLWLRCPLDIRMTELSNTKLRTKIGFKPETANITWSIISSLCNRIQNLQDGNQFHFSRLCMCQAQRQKDINAASYGLASKESSTRHDVVRRQV